MRDELDKHLTGLKRQYQITTWHDGEIQPGTDWSKEISIQLEATNIIFLLISVAFLTSDYCYGIEMKRAAEELVSSAWQARDRYRH